MTLELLKRAFRFWVSLLKIARQRSYSYVLQHTYIVWIVAANLRRQIEIFRVLAMPAFRGLILLDPRFPFKFTITNYLARGLTAGERASCFLHHYRHLDSILPPGFLIQAFERGWTIYESEHAGVRYSITLSLPDSSEHREGELSLQFHVDGVRIYVLQFTVVPGWIVQSEASSVMLISRIQGVRGCYPLIQSTTKAFFDVAPPTLLVGALHGVARVLEVDEWAGIAAEKQTCFGWDRPDMFNTAYDEFFTNQGGTRTASEFFLGCFNERKPLDPVNNGHKARKKKRRAIRLKLANDVAGFIFWRCAEFAVLPDQAVQNPSAVRESEMQSVV